MLTDSLGSRSLRFVSPLRPKKKKKNATPDTESRSGVLTVWPVRALPTQVSQ